jgi:hypothetical protein
LEFVDDAEGERELGTDDGQVDLELLGEIGELDDVGHPDRDAVGHFRDARIPRRGVDLPDHGGLLELPAQRVLPRTLTDHQNSHVPKIVAVAGFVIPKPGQGPGWVREGV